MRGLPQGEHALHPLLVALLLLILAVKPLVVLRLLPVFAMALGLQAVILAGLFCLDEAAHRTRHLVVVTVLSALGLQSLALQARRQACCPPAPPPWRSAS